ncbi:MAG: SGNH/GDSL hydrolase family protein [Oscillospiraceae bacterium]|nr:SGNH/GDSL hydrolase family protein [Oscillospiraceae bacterium]
MEKPTYFILFIGNSYTYYNDMPTAIFEKIAEKMGYQVDVTAITKGAHKLSQFADPNDEYGAKVEKALTGAKKYDYVVVQEQSVLPAAENAPAFYDAVRNFAARIRSTGAKPVLYATWGRKTGSSTLTSKGWTNESMTWKLAAAYQAIGDELEIPVAHVGLVFYDVYTNQTGLELYDDDKSHPSTTGSYLAAVTLFAKIFAADPTEVTYTGGLSADNARILCEAARKAVFETRQIPQEYQTTSEKSE